MTLGWDCSLCALVLTWFNEQGKEPNKPQAPTPPELTRPDPGISEKRGAREPVKR